MNHSLNFFYLFLVFDLKQDFSSKADNDDYTTFNDLFSSDY